MTYAPARSKLQADSGADPSVQPIATTEGSADRANRAIGAIVFAVMGGIWLGVASLTTLDQPLTPLFGIVIVIGLLIAAGVRVLRAHGSAMRKPEPGSPQARAVRWFNIINGMQWTAVVLLILALNAIGHPEWIVPGVIAVVGLHFLPLASLFHYPPHAYTGAALLAIAVAEPAFASPSPNHPLAAVGTGLVLWLSALRALRAAAPATTRAAA